MEFIKCMNLKKRIEAYGLFDIDTVRIIVYKILLLLKDLSKIDWYHGRLNISNIHIDDMWRVKLTDYGYMSIIDMESDFTTEEGSRLDIFWLGICILKMLGKLRPNDGGEGNIDAYYLENMQMIKDSYKNVGFLLKYLILTKFYRISQENSTIMQ